MDDLLTSRELMDRRMRQFFIPFGIPVRAMPGVKLEPGEVVKSVNQGRAYIVDFSYLGHGPGKIIVVDKPSYQCAPKKTEPLVRTDYASWRPCLAWI